MLTAVGCFISVGLLSHCCVYVYEAWVLNMQIHKVYFHKKKKKKSVQVIEKLFSSSKNHIKKINFKKSINTQLEATKQA